MKDEKLLRKNVDRKRIISIILIALMTVSLLAVVPSEASNSSNIQEIAELQQLINKQGYNYTVAENWITRLSAEEREALFGYKPIKAYKEPPSENLGFVLDVSEPAIDIGAFEETITSIQSSYDAMALGYVTSIKDQSTCGSCWIFASSADFESDVAIGDSSLFDFAEQEVGDCNIWSSVGGYDFCNGGNRFMSTNYFTRYGSANETCHPYEASLGTCQQCPMLKNVDNWRIITGYDGNDSNYINTIKNAIINYGPVYSTIYANDSGFLSYSSGVYEYWGSEDVNHAIEIIGWNDSLPHSKGNGAWLIKNSWGTDWGVSGPYPGCGWIAYGAANIGDLTSAITGYKEPGDTLLYHDEGGWMGWSLGYNNPTAYGAVRFTPSNDSTLTAMDFWAVDPNMNYEIKIFDTLNNLGGGNYSFSNQIGNTQTGTTNEEGYYSIPLDLPIFLKSGNDFIVQIRLTTTGWIYPISVDYTDDPSLNWAAVTTFSGESYSSYDGLQFEKLSLYDIGIRARTVAQAIITEPEEGAYIKGTFYINGTADDTDFSYYSVEWKNTSVDWTEIKSSTAPVSDGTLAIWDTTAVENGNYMIRLTVTDTVSSSIMTLVNVTIDNTQPTAMITEPEEGAYVKGTVDINGTAADANFKIYTVEWKNTTTAWTEIQNSTEPVSNGTLVAWDTTALEDGNYMIRLTVLDNASNSNMSTINITVDNAIQAAIITEPEEGAYIKGTVYINGTVVDANFKNYTVEWKNTTAAWTEIQNSTEPVSDGTLAAWDTTTQEDGNYMIRLTVMDNAYNSVNITVNVTIDNTPPTTMITEPEEGAYVKGTVYINGTAADTNFKIYTVEWKNTTSAWTEMQNSTEPVSDGTLAAWDTTALEDGNYMIRLTVLDNAFGSNMTAINVTVDNAIPVAIITEPEEGAYIKGTVYINGTAADPNFKIYTVEWKNTTAAWTEIQNSTEPVSDGTLAAWDTATQEDGNNMIRLTVMDNAYHSVNITVNVTIDNTPPTAMAIVEYQKGTAANNGSTVILNVTANDNAGGSGIKNVTANVSAVNNSGPISLIKQGNYWAGNAVVAAADGDHPINITVTDNASNVNFTKVNVTMDNTPPGVYNVMAQPELVNRSGFTNITANISDPDLKNVSVSAEITFPNSTANIYNMTGNGPTYYLNFTNTADLGRYEVTIIANDATGNINNIQKTSFIVAYIYTNNSVIIPADNSTFINASYVTVEIFANNSITGSIYITRSIVNITQELGVSGPEIYVRIDASSNFSQENISWALINVYYTDEEVNNLVESSLRLYWFNESSHEWIKLESNVPWVMGSGVDTDKNSIWANVTHFSDYAVGGELKEEEEEEISRKGGGRGGGGGTGEDYDNIECFVIDRQFVEKGSPVSYNFSNGCSIVKHINFTALTTSGTVVGKVEILKNTSTLVNVAPPNMVFWNLNLWIGYAGWANEDNLKDVTIAFVVDKSWIQANNIDTDLITLNRFVNDSWIPLQTKQIGEKDDVLIFTAHTSPDGFGNFAVTGVMEEAAAEVISTPIIESRATPLKTPSPEPAKKYNIWVLGLVILLAAVVLVYLKKDQISIWIKEQRS